MKKAIIFILAALVIFSCNVTKPNDNNSSNNNQGGSQQVAPLRQGLVAEYLMGEDSYDSSGNDNHAFLNGPFPTLNRHGKIRSAYLFDGVDDYLEVKDHPTLHSERALTISVWLNVKALPQGLDNYYALFWKGDTTLSGEFANREYALWLGNDGHLHPTSTPEGATSQKSFYSSPSLIRVGEWQHVVLTIDSELGKMKLYVDGTFIEELPDYGNKNIKTTKGPLLLGRRKVNHSNQNFFNGKLDDFRLYNRILTDSEIKELYKSK